MACCCIDVLPNTIIYAIFQIRRSHFFSNACRICSVSALRIQLSQQANLMLLDRFIFVVAEMVLVFHLSFCIVMFAVASPILALISSKELLLNTGDCIRLIGAAYFLGLFPIRVDHEFRQLATSFALCSPPCSFPYDNSMTVPYFRVVFIHHGFLS